MNGIFILLLVCFLMHEEHFFSYQICRAFLEFRFSNLNFAWTAYFRVGSTSGWF